MRASSATLCLVQGAQAQAALQAMGAEAGAPANDKKTLSARVQEAVQRSSATISRAINGTVHRWVVLAINLNGLALLPERPKLGIVGAAVCCCCDRCAKAALRSVAGAVPGWRAMCPRM